MSNAAEVPRSLPTSGFKTIEADQPVEEELPDYQVDPVYPVRLGEVFQDTLLHVGWSYPFDIWIVGLTVGRSLDIVCIYSILLLGS